MSEHLPDDVVAKILTKLPVISLIRFTCVSKGWRSIISDPLFAKSYDEQRSANPRLLIGRVPELLESLDLETVPSDMRKLPSPFKLPTDKRVSLLGSCNGLICLTESHHSTSPFIWNPSTGMLQKLPHPELPKVIEDSMFQYAGIFQCTGFGYLSATDEYKVVLSMFTSSGGLDVKVFSFRAQVWKSIQSQPASYIGGRTYGLLLNEALHWHNGGGFIDIFDLATDQFRTMPLPEFLRYPDGPHHQLSICVSRGSLYLFRCRVISEFSRPCYYGSVDSDAVELWIMSEYGVPESWTKLRTFRVSDVSKWIFQLTPIFVMETSTVAAYVINNDKLELVRVEHEEGKPAVIEYEEWNICRPDFVMIVYEESLHWIHDIHGVGETVKTQASGSKNE